MKSPASAASPAGPLLDRTRNTVRNPLGAPEPTCAHCAALRAAPKTYVHSGTARTFRIRCSAAQGSARVRRPHRRETVQKTCYLRSRPQAPDGHVSLHICAGCGADLEKVFVTNRNVVELRRFLIEARAKVKPESAGLVTLGRRRVPGLRRGEVAELAGISETWYTRFESGKVSLSVSALHRVADALGLDRAHRHRLVHLARPDVARASLGGLEEAFSGLQPTVAALREFVLKCRAAATIEEIGTAATLAVTAVCGKSSFSYMRAFEKATNELPIVGVYGRGSDALIGHRLSADSVWYAMPHFHAGQQYGEVDLRMSPCIDLRTRIDRVGVHAYHTHPILGKLGLELMIGVAMREPRAPDPVETHILETAATIVELTLRH